MNYRNAILLFLLVLTVFSAYSFSINCTGYKEYVNVRVLDAKLRPIQNAAVWLTYDRGLSGNNQYATTKKQYTNSEGIFSFYLVNDGRTTQLPDCNILISASAGNQEGKITVIATAHATLIDVPLDQTYPIHFLVRDQNLVPLPNATLSIGNMSLKTDSNGEIYTYLRSGSYNYFLSYLEGTQTGSFAVTDDLNYEILLPFYSISFDVIDDFGQPLNSTLTLFNRTQRSDAGHFEIGKAFGSSIYYMIEFAGHIKEGRVDAPTRPNTQIIFDIHAPVFGDIRPDSAGETFQLLIPVTDPGPYSNGINPGSLKVTYHPEPGDSVWSDARIYTKNKNLYVAEFPNLSANKIVSFRAEIQDNEGNKASIDGKFSTFKSPPSNTTPAANLSSNPNLPPDQPKEQGFPLLYIVIGAIVLFLAIYLIFRLKSKA